ncbi:pyrimidine-nucleoside phosphorylase [Chengkuizengella sediminis]|uniref:pyrimidine-nucleoside phosphorylase n=1 Tax=Chengkuizengella sediminis TaxID=1885917 RepID=UPI00138A5F44|nr:pyrimidine-nucleoside phosphorylase [Chengkuizengella sediminis]NDI34278.1 pyrimidine-nucleoside phosphorylase [Chengkuizengella sediminis]
MRMVDLISKKREGLSLSRDEIQFMIKGYTEGTIPDYQMSAWAMAVFFQGLDIKETSDLTMEMARSGDQVDLSGIQGIKVDKHSTGGVGDKTSLIVVPLVASVGVPVAKMSGRGLGHTGGTVDKLESIEGFKIELTKEQFFQNVNDFKMALVGQSGNLTPADKKLYGLRDVTGTVNSMPLIASSIMSKKIASGADAIVLDVKVGAGAFMKSLEDAKELAKTMVSIGNHLNRKTVAVITDMNQPLGFEIGNANEVREAIEVLSGKGEERLTKVCLTLASHMAVAGQVFPDFNTAYQKLEEILRTGKALETFAKFIEAQGGNSQVVTESEKLPQAQYHIEVTAEQGGYIEEINAEAMGNAAMYLGAGRKTKEDQIDYAVGISLKKKVADEVTAGEVIALIHSNSENVQDSYELIKQSVKISSDRIEELPIIYEVVE